MKITPYRVLFKLEQLASKQKKYYGKPTEKMEPVNISEDGSYCEVHTHDWGEEDESYYLISFKIEDPSPYKLENLSLHLDSAVYRNADRAVNDLYYDPECQLWYQKIQYTYNEKAHKYNVKVGSDCVTTSGVFRIVVMRGSEILEQYPQPWVYVLPNGISKDDYIRMLSDLIQLHEALVTRKKSTVGVGTAMQREIERVQQEVDLTNDLIQTVKQIMQLPSELLAKQYAKKDLRKIRHFDARAIREYIHRGASGKVMGAEYIEDYDTYENRIIKYFLDRLSRRIAPEYEASDVTMNVEKTVEEEFKHLSAKRGAPPPPVVRTLSFIGKPPLNQNVPLTIVVDGNTVLIEGHKALAGEGKEVNKLEFHARTESELIFYLQKLVECYDKIDNTTSSPRFKITCSINNSYIKNKNGLYPYMVYSISNCTEINGTPYAEHEMSAHDYQCALDELSQGRNYLNTRNRLFEIKPMHKVVVQLSDEEEGMKKELKKKIAARKERAKACDKLLKIHQELEMTLQDSWFEHIALIPDLQEDIRLTSKFQSNPFYSRIYELIIKAKELFPLLTATFNVNAFGVNKTEEVYEYWVFYKLLYELSALGFNFDEEDQTKRLTNNFQKFIEDNANQKKYSGFSIHAIHSNPIFPLKIEIGYEKEFETTFKRTPDFYICIEHQKCLHWYFIDAKYKKYKRTSYLKEIYETSIEKYIYDMNRILKEHPIFGAFNNKICGSYIAMANSTDGNKPLAENGRLFGEKKSIFDEQDLFCNNIPMDTMILKDEIDTTEESLPGHRYGAIMLTPSHDKELKSLLWLIFEYLESDKTDDEETNPNLKLCWKCGSPVNRERVTIPIMDSDSLVTKYYATCTNESCQAFRVDNHCRSCGALIVKHTSDNYHRWDDSVEHNQWAFLCPQCGAGVEKRNNSPNVSTTRKVKSPVGIAQHDLWDIFQDFF